LPKNKTLKERTMADEKIEMIESEKKKEDWMNSKWRPMMGWMYMLVCTMDFVGFPILWSLLQSISHGAVNVQWQPLTLQGAGLFHIAMGAVIGISAYGRTQEKLNGANNGGLSLPAGSGTTYTPPAPIAGGGFGGNTAPTGGFGGGSFGSAPPAPASGGLGGSAGFGTPAVTTGFGGKPAPVQPAQPAI
jgi:Holin of 3TMs, for gene-transfer release